MRTSLVNDWKPPPLAYRSKSTARDRSDSSRNGKTTLRKAPNKAAAVIADRALDSVEHCNQTPAADLTVVGDYGVFGPL
jgi:hypothetical protein